MRHLLPLVQSMSIEGIQPGKYLPQAAPRILLGGTGNNRIIWCIFSDTSILYGNLEWRKCF